MSLSHPTNNIAYLKLVYGN